MDQKDLEILNILQKNADISNIELSKKVKLSAPPCLRRVNYLEEKKIILGYYAKINPRALKFEFEAFAEVTLPKVENAFEIFESYVNSWVFVRSYYMVAGSSDYILRIIAPTFSDYNDFVTNSLRSVVAEINTFVVARSYEKHFVPIENISICNETKSISKIFKNNKITFPSVL